VSTPPPTGNREFSGDAVRLAELTVTTFTLDTLVFRNCQIIGPAILIPVGTTSLLHCSWDTPNLDALFWEIAPDRNVVVGAILARNCIFSACRFTQVGLAGPRSLRERLESGLTD
jgi:hypothetical protein